jgi:hypothetical protein
MEPTDLSLRSSKLSSYYNGTSTRCHNTTSSPRDVTNLSNHPVETRSSSKDRKSAFVPVAPSTIPPALPYPAFFAGLPTPQSVSSSRSGQAPGKRPASAGQAPGKRRASARQAPGKLIKRRESISSSYITEIRIAGLVLGKRRASLFCWLANSSCQVHLAPGKRQARAGQATGKRQASAGQAHLATTLQQFAKLG